MNEKCICFPKDFQAEGTNKFTASLYGSNTYALAIVAETEVAGGRTVGADSAAHAG